MSDRFLVNLANSEHRRLLWFMVGGRVRGGVVCRREDQTAQLLDTKLSDWFWVRLVGCEPATSTLHAMRFKVYSIFPQSVSIFPQTFWFTGRYLIPTVHIRESKGRCKSWELLTGETER